MSHAIPQNSIIPNASGTYYLQTMSISMPVLQGEIAQGLICQHHAIPSYVKRIYYQAVFHQGAKGPEHGGDGSQASEHHRVLFNNNIIYDAFPKHGSVLDTDTGYLELIGWKHGESLSILMYATENGHWPVNTPTHPYPQNNKLIVGLFVP